MYAQTRLLRGFKKILTYHIPDHLKNVLCVGMLVHVPLKNYKTLGYVIHITPDLEVTHSYSIKDILAIVPFPVDQHYQAFLGKLSDYYVLEPLFFLNRLRLFLTHKELQHKDPSFPLNDDQNTSVVLTAQQKDISEHLKRAITNQEFKPTLLYGVTGSGKTEVYKTLIEHAIKEHKSVIFLVPEVTLAVQFFTLFRTQLPSEIELYSFHSASSAQEKKCLWQALIAQKPVVVIGVHLPSMLPINNLGLIIVDEEHEVGYQEKKHPKINTKEAALLRAQTYTIPIVLGSATPSITSLYQVHQKKWQMFELKERFAGAFPQIKIVELLKDQQRPIFWLSTVLVKEIRDRLVRREQTILFLNRRGYSFFVVCKQCSFVFTCSSCSVSLTLHNDNSLRCHYCNYHKQLPPHCPSCKAPEQEFLKKGIGTQQLAALVATMFPTARVGRADLDSTVNKKKWQKTLQEFQKGDLDILVGTQMITKGYHFPRVTLVGVIWADANIHFPKYNATETALQQLIQVAGRAGRQTSESTVIVQTLTQHPAFNYIEETKYLDFYEQEIEKRAVSTYPPFTRLAEIEIRHRDESILEQEAATLATLLEHKAQNNNYLISILGPAMPPVAKIKDTHSRLIYIKSSSTAGTRTIYLEAIKDNQFMCSIFFTPSV